MPGYSYRDSLRPNTFNPYEEEKSDKFNLFSSNNSIESSNNKKNQNHGETFSNTYPRELKTTFFEPNCAQNSDISLAGPSGLRDAFIKRTPYLQQHPIMMDSNILDSSSNSADSDRSYNRIYEQFRDNNSRVLEDDNNIECLEDQLPSGFYSMHRLSQFNKPPDCGGNLKRAFEARIGGTSRRSIKNTDDDNILENHANFIVFKMVKDEALMENSPDAEELRRTTVREMPQSLTIKRSVKEKLSRSVSLKSKRRTLSWWKMFKYRTSIAFVKLQYKIKDILYSFELWYGILKNVEGNFGTGVASYFKFVRWLFILNFMIALISTSFIFIPVAIFGSEKTETINWSIFFDLITGEGYFTNTPLYYGFYSNKTVGLENLPYSISHSYFFTMMLIYVVSLAFIGISAAQSYRKSYIETEGGLKNVFANKILCGWDFNIATVNAANLKSKAIFNELKELISEFTRPKENKSFYQKFLTISIQVIMNILILALIFGCGAAIWYFLEKVSLERNYRIIIVPIFINLVMTILPLLLSLVVRCEDYKNPKIALFITIIRTFIMGAVNIAVLVTFWLKREEISCWETDLGQEFYRMILFDLFISVICTALFEVLFYFILKYSTKNSNLEFDIAWNTMQIIYNQTLFWVGLVFSPLLPLVMVIKLFLIWYIRYASVVYLCKPSTKSWRAAQTSTWFLVMTFLSLLCVAGLIGYIISYVKVSNTCGPFVEYDYIYEIVTNGIFNIRENNTLLSIFLLLTQPGVIAIFFLFFFAAVYYVREKANAQKEIVKQCRHLLYLSAKDKEHLYYLILKASKGNFHEDMHDKYVNPELCDPVLVKNRRDYNVLNEVPTTSSFTHAGDNNNKSYQPRYKKES